MLFPRVVNGRAVPFQRDENGLRKIHSEQDGLEELNWDVYKDKTERLGSETGWRMCPDGVEGQGHQKKDHGKKHGRHNKKLCCL
jgi:hypothetical protein